MGVSQSLYPVGEWSCSDGSVDEIPEEKDGLRRVSRDQGGNALLDFCHSPVGKQSARRPLAKFVSVMEVGHGQPFIRLMIKRQTGIEPEIFGDKEAAGHEGDSTFRPILAGFPVLRGGFRSLPGSPLVE